MRTNLGETLRRGRKRARLSQERAAEGLAVDVSTVSRYECNRIKRPDLVLVGRAMGQYPQDELAAILGAIMGNVLAEILLGLRGKEKDQLLGTAGPR